MVNTQQPTRHTHHIDIKTFVGQDWVQHDLLSLEDISTHGNCGDVFTKALGHQLHHHHSDTYMGKHILQYAKCCVFQPRPHDPAVS